MEKLFIPLLVSCVTGGKIVLINKVNFVLLRLKQKKQDMITSVKLMLNKSRILNNGSYPLVFQVIHNRRKKLLYTGYRVKEEVFDELEGKIMNGVSSTFTATEVVKMNRELRKMRNQIDTRIRQLERTREEFTVEDILAQNAFGGDHPSQTTHQAMSFYPEVRTQTNEGSYFNSGSTNTGVPDSMPPTYPTHRVPKFNAKL